MQVVKKIRDWLTGKSRLKDDELEIWLGIQEKAKRGYLQWYKKTGGNDMCGPWIPDLTKEESELLDRIYRKFHGGSYISSLSVSGDQVAYQMYSEIKTKIYY